MGGLSSVLSASSLGTAVTVVGLPLCWELPERDQLDNASVAFTQSGEILTIVPEDGDGGGQCDDAHHHQDVADVKEDDDDDNDEEEEK
ncbi:hypothetical protein ACROYT_G027057 [Oculina patagonica]